MKIESEIVNTVDELITIREANWFLFCEYVKEYGNWFYYISVRSGHPSIAITKEQYDEIKRQLTQVNT